MPLRVRVAILLSLESLPEILVKIGFRSNFAMVFVSFLVVCNLSLFFFAERFAFLGKYMSEGMIMFTPFGRDFCFVQHSSSKLGFALAYRKNSYILRICFVDVSYILTPFSRDFCFARHSSSKLDSALAYRKNS